jgi:hypothetical protein
MVLATVLALAVAAPLPAGAIYMLKLFAFQVTHWSPSKTNAASTIWTGRQQVCNKKMRRSALAKSSRSRDQFIERFWTEILAIRSH